MTSERWTRIEDDPELALRLVDRAREEAEAAGRKGEVRGLEIFRASVEARQTRGTVLTDSAGKPEGLAVWEVIEGIGRRIRYLYLVAPRRVVEGWTRFFAGLFESPEPSGPIVLIQGSLTGLTSVEAESVLGHRGFYPFHREQLMLAPDRPLPTAAPDRPAPGEIRMVDRRDFDRLAELNAASYEREVERFLYATMTDPVQDARRLLQSLVDGVYGKPVDEASLVLEIDGALRGAILVTRLPEYLLIADVEVHPAARGHGQAGRLMRASLDALSRSPRLPIGLAVIRENVAAAHTYSSLGFTPTGREETVWADTTRLGIDRPSKPGGSGELGRINS